MKLIWYYQFLKKAKSKQKNNLLLCVALLWSWMRKEYWTVLNSSVVIDRKRSIVSTNYKQIKSREDLGKLRVSFKTCFDFRQNKSRNQFNQFLIITRIEHKVGCPVTDTICNAISFIDTSIMSERTMPFVNCYAMFCSFLVMLSSNFHFIVIVHWNTSQLIVDVLRLTALCYSWCSGRYMNAQIIVTDM